MTDFAVELHDTVLRDSGLNLSTPHNFMFLLIYEMQVIDNNFNGVKLVDCLIY